MICRNTTCCRVICSVVTISMSEEEKNNQLPLSEAVFFILLSLAPRPKHGYAILKDVESLSQRRVVLSTGTLYGAIKRLLAQGWIEPAAEVGGAEDDSAEPPRGRKAYALTELGRSILQAEASRLQSLVDVAQLRLA